MSIILKYGAAALVLFLSLAATVYTSYKWGFNAARLEQSNEINQQLAKAAQHIIDEQAKLQAIEDIISKDDDKSVVKSPVVIRTLVRVRDECSGKTTC